MENPYRHAAEPLPEGSDVANLSEYEAAIGAQAAYYAPIFSRFEGGARPFGWNWPAFVASSPWFFYRKMWLLGSINIVCTLLLCVLILAMGFVIRGMHVPPLSLPRVLYVMCALLILPALSMPVFANWLYWRHVRRNIERAVAQFAEQPAKLRARLMRDGRTTLGAPIAILVCGTMFTLVAVSVLGVLAVPAYAHYSMQAQIDDGFALADPVKTRVADYWERRREWPEQVDMPGDIPHSVFVESVRVASGSVVITYTDGVLAHTGNSRLFLVPGIDAAGKIVWVCGNAKPAPGVTTADGPSGSDLLDARLPIECRAQQPTL